jgi:hypothetical protein
MTITTKDQRPPLVILPELVEADRRVAACNGREPLSEERLRWAVVRAKEQADELRARGVPIEDPAGDADDPYEQRELARRWNRIADNGLLGREDAA